MASVLALVLASVLEWEPALVSAKVFTAREARWLPGRLQCGAGAVTISTALGQSIVFNISSIDHVKVGKDAL